MLRSITRWTAPSLHLPISPNLCAPFFNCSTIVSMPTTDKARNVLSDQLSTTVSWSRCNAKRRVRYEDEDEDEDEYGHNEELAWLELYSQTARGEALLLHALVDDEEIEVLIFKGFSSSLSHGTSPDPSRSVLPSRAVIKSIDRIKGPFDPSNIEYIEKGVPWPAFQTRLSTPTTFKTH